MKPAAKQMHELIVRYGPVVMNMQEEIDRTWQELCQGIVEQSLRS